VQRVTSVLQFVWRSTKRVVVMLIGAALLLGGLVMLVTPGPGIVLIIAGLAVLATEFVWAERMLDKAKAHAAAATNKVRRRRGRTRPTAAPGTTTEALASGPPDTPETSDTPDTSGPPDTPDTPPTDATTRTP
jgi:uncharacterized protein (TIGR02611 family)